MAKILLAEDDANLRILYEARLTAEGYEVIAAEDGEKALALATEQRPDVIVCDVMMPKLSGFEMLDILRTGIPSYKPHIIMLTALSQREDKERAADVGADVFFIKSQVTMEDLINEISKMLAAR